MPLLLICVNAALLAALVLLAVWVVRLRAWGRRTAREVMDLSVTVAAVQGWAAQELRALRSEFTVQRVDASAAKVLARPETRRAASPAATPQLEEDPDEQRDTVAMSAPVAKPGDDDDETTFFEPVPLYASCSPLIRAPAPREPLAHPDLIGCEDIADEANSPHLGPDETTPPRHGRAALLVPAFRGPEQGKTA
jgi:hypothetical protein